MTAEPHHNIDAFIDGIVARLGALDRRHPPIRDDDPDFNDDLDRGR